MLSVKVLAGTSKVCDAGNIQVFTKSGGHIINESEATQVIAAIHKAKGKKNRRHICV